MPKDPEIQKPSIFKTLMKDMTDLSAQNGAYPKYIVLGVNEHKEWTEHRRNEEMKVGARPDYRETGESLLGAEILRSAKLSCVTYIR